MQQNKQVNFDSLSNDALIRIIFLTAIVGMSIPTIWRKAKQGTFPKPIKVSDNITCWRVGDVRTWLKDPQSWGK